ncbi:hypothetical protein JCM10213v2_008236 [Rhodosporidiobolus nylandii]
MGIISRLEVPAKEGAARSLDNEDLRPTPRSRRTWGFTTFSLFWFTAVGNVSNMTSGATWLTLGFSYWQAIFCSFAGYFIISWVMVFNGRPGAKWHIGFPVICRSSFGIYGAGWPALNRAFMACLWQGINAVSGAQSLYLMLHAIFPSIAHVGNHMDLTKSALNSIEMVCFFLFQGAVALTCCLSVPRWNWLVYTKVVVFIYSSVGLLAWSISAGGGVGPVVTQPSQLHGTELAWSVVRMILTQRNAIKPSDPIVGNVLGFPLSNFLTQVIGMLAASASKGIYGKIVWNPVTLIGKLLADDYTPAHRAGAFFIGAGFCYSLLYSCVFENVYCCGNDLASLCPRFISVKRGFMICIAVSCLLNPWYLMSAASIMITVVSSYQIFLFAIIGVMLVDYYAIAKGWLDMEALFVPRGKYYYWHGVNPRAFAAYFVGVAVNFAGFLTNFDIIVNERLTHSYYFSILTTTGSSAFTYFLLNKLYPQPNYQLTWSEPCGIWEPTDEQAMVGGVAGATLAVEEEKPESFDKDDEARAEIIAAPELPMRS